MTALKTSTAPKVVVAILAATISFAALTPAAFAAGPDRGGRDFKRGEMQGHRQDGDMHQMRQMGGRGGQILAIGCGPNAAERIDTGLVRLGYRVDATDEQKALLETLKTAALAAQTELAAVCESVMPAVAAAPADATAPAATPPAEQPDLLERLQMRQTIAEARVAAMGNVLPQFEAFFNSLTDEQKASLEPRARDGRGPGKDGGPRGDRGRNMDRNR